MKKSLWLLIAVAMLSFGIVMPVIAQNATDTTVPDESLFEIPEFESSFGQTFIDLPVFDTTLDTDAFRTFMLNDDEALSNIDNLTTAFGIPEFESSFGQTFTDLPVFDTTLDTDAFRTFMLDNDASSGISDLTADRFDLPEIIWY